MLLAFICLFIVLYSALKLNREHVLDFIVNMDLASMSFKYLQLTGVKSSKTSLAIIPFTVDIATLVLNNLEAAVHASELDQVWNRSKSNEIWTDVKLRSI